MCPLGMAISPLCHCKRSPFVIASEAWRSRVFRVRRTRNERLLRRLAMTKTPVIASVAFLSSRGTWRSRLSGADKQKSEIASQARNDSRRASAAQCALWVWRSRLCGGWQTKKRDCFVPRNDSRRASAAQCALWVWRSRLFRAGKQKSEIASCLAMTKTPVIASGAQCALWVRRSRLFEAGKQKSEIASQARNDRLGMLRASQ